MRNVLYLLKNYPLTLLCLSLIVFLSLMIYIPETPLDDVAFIDKWTHLVMYGGSCSVIWFEHLRLHKGNPVWWKLTIYAVVGMVVLGGVIELIQPYFQRSGEWLDFVADAVGVALGALTGLLMRAVMRRRSR